MGYSSYSTEFKIECVRRYFSQPRISARLLALEKEVPFHTLQDWIKKARKARHSASRRRGYPPPRPPAEAVTISIGKTTVTMPSSLLSQALEALLRQ